MFSKQCVMMSRSLGIGCGITCYCGSVEMVGFVLTTVEVALGR